MRWKVYPEYMDSGIDWLEKIPNEWMSQRLKYNSYIKGRIGWQNLRSEEFIEEGPFLVTGMHFKDGNVDWDSCFHINEERYLMAPEIFVKENDILITKDGSIGKLAFIRNLPGKTSLNSHLLIIRPQKQSYYPRFLYFLLGSEVFQHFVLIEQSGTTFYGISQESVENFPALFPSEREQQAIASFLDRETEHIDNLIAKKKRQIELLQEKRSTLISHVVTKGLNPDVKMRDSGVEWVGNIPQHWNVNKLKYLAKVTPSNVDKDSAEDEIPVRLCNYTDVYNNEYIYPNLNLMNATASMGEIAKFGLKKGDVLVTKDSEEWSDIAVPAYIDSEMNGIICGYHLAQIRPLNTDIFGEYLFRAFSARGINDQFRVEATGITRYGLGKYSLDNALFPVPPFDEQLTISLFLRQETQRIDNTNAKIRDSIQKLQEYRTALISAAVTGKIDVRQEATL